jgi:hypothetical protein
VLLIGTLAAGACSGLRAQESLRIIAVQPAALSAVGRLASITVDFDRPVAPLSIHRSSFRAFGRGSGAVSGEFTFANGDRTVTLTPGRPFSAGETVLVNLCRDVMGADGTFLRSAGFAWQFGIRTSPASREFEEIDVLHNRTTPDARTRIYGAMASDLNGDGFLDLTTVNEVSADLRVFLSRADGSGNFLDDLPPVPIGPEASPNEPADFDNDGNVDVCVSAADDASIWIALGSGDGTFASLQEVEVGGTPYGIAVLDADGDADLDVASANNGSDNLALLVNDGRGSFGEPAFFEGGVDGEYGLAAGDMDGDGITDLVTGGRDGRRINVLLGTGGGAFLPAADDQSTGGLTWVVALGDLNGDGKLDATTANSTSGNGAALLGNGDGTFGPPELVETGAHNASTDVGDLDGDGDLDWVLSNFGGGFWRLYTNDGEGNFTFDQEFTATSNPSCAILLDLDNDGDLDMALTDEIADEVVLMENGGGSPGLFARGNSNGDAQVDLSDAVLGLLHLFAGRSDLRCLEALDADDNGEVNVSDPVFLLGYLFRDLAAPPGPLECGADPTPDALGCESSACTAGA